MLCYYFTPELQCGINLYSVINIYNLHMYTLLHYCNEEIVMKGSVLS